MSAIETISTALGYDAFEAALAAGVPFYAAAMAEAARFEAYPVDADCSPASVRDVTVSPATVRPGSR